MTAARIVPFGDAAVLVELDTVGVGRRTPGGRGRSRDAVVGAAGRRIARAGLGVPVPAAASLLVPFDPLATDAAAVAALLAPLLTGEPPSPRPPATADRATEHVLRVRYGGDDGPDLDAVAAETGLTPDDVIALHAGRPYEVLFIGFAPGFAYLGEVPERARRPPARDAADPGARRVGRDRRGDDRGLPARLGRRLAPARPDGRPPVRPGRGSAAARLRPGDRVRFEPA